MTSHTPRGASKPELFITNGIATTQPEVQMGGCSADIVHDAVTITMETETVADREQVHVHMPTHLRQSDTLLTKAKRE